MLGVSNCLTRAVHSVQYESETVAQIIAKIALNAIPSDSRVLAKEVA